MVQQMRFPRRLPRSFSSVLFHSQPATACRCSCVCACRRYRQCTSGASDSSKRHRWDRDFGATNLPENVDAAVTRPGRFDRHIVLENPNRAGIVRIFEIELGNGGTDLDLGQSADRLLGMSGAQAAAVVRDARGKARRARTALSNAHLAAALPIRSW